MILRQTRAISVSGSITLQIVLGKVIVRKKRDRIKGFREINGHDTKTYAHVIREVFSTRSSFLVFLHDFAIFV